VPSLTLKCRFQYMSIRHCAKSERALSRRWGSWTSRRTVTKHIAANIQTNMWNIGTTSEIFNKMWPRLCRHQQQVYRASLFYLKPLHCQAVYSVEVLPRTRCQTERNGCQLTSSFNQLSNIPPQGSQLQLLTETEGDASIFLQRPVKMVVSETSIKMYHYIWHSCIQSYFL
jgi:hypothetical protein